MRVLTTAPLHLPTGSAGVADNAVMECDSHGDKCGLQLGYTHNNNGRCFQLRLNTSAEVGGKGWQWPSSGPESIDIITLMTSNCLPHQVGGKGWQWPSSGPESIDIIMQSINTGLNNAFDLYMAQGGAGAWASNDAFGRHSTCSHLWGNVPGLHLIALLIACVCSPRRPNVPGFNHTSNCT